VCVCVCVCCDGFVRHRKKRIGGPVDYVERSSSAILRNEKSQQWLRNGDGQKKIRVFFLRRPPLPRYLNRGFSAGWWVKIPVEAGTEGRGIAVQSDPPPYPKKKNQVLKTSKKEARGS